MFTPFSSCLYCFLTRILCNTYPCTSLGKLPPSFDFCQDFLCFCFSSVPILCVNLYYRGVNLLVFMLLGVFCIPGSVLWYLSYILENSEPSLLQILLLGASLVAQWLRIRLPVQGTRVWSLVREDPTCRGATKPVRHNYWACALEPVSHNYWAHMLQLLKPTHLEPVLCSKRGHCNEKPVHCNEE